MRNKARTLNKHKFETVYHCRYLQSPFVKRLMAANKIDKKELEGKNEKYILQVITNPCEGVEEAVVIIGSDRRGTIYGIYELSEQIGVSPWYW